MNKVKSIYKITNKINGKIYIGQAKDCDKRWKRHCVNYGARGGSKKNSSIINKAILKYGKENFTFEILEKDIENYNEKEDFWIKFFNCKIPNGYNVLDGGTYNKPLPGEDNPSFKHTEEEILEIKNLLKNTNMTFKEIAEKFNYNSISTIGFINDGSIWKDSNEQYPLRSHKKGDKLSEELIKSIQQDLLTTNLTQDQIAKKYNKERHLITDINQGYSYKNSLLEYPIRKTKKQRKQLTKEEKEQIFKDLIYSKDTFTKIAKKYNVSIATISNMNNGYVSKNEKLKYPIKRIQRRKFKYFKIRLLSLLLDNLSFL